MHFFHRLLVNGGELRLGLVDDRLDLRLLVFGQIELLAQMLERVFHHLVRPARPVMIRAVLARFLGLEVNERGQRQRRRGCN